VANKRVMNEQEWNLLEDFFRGKEETTGKGFSLLQALLDLKARVEDLEENEKGAFAAVDSMVDMKADSVDLKDLEESLDRLETKLEEVIKKIGEE